MGHPKIEYECTSRELYFPLQMWATRQLKLKELVRLVG
jgi:hypothetical protein